MKTSPYEMTTLKRSTLGRVSGSKPVAEMLLEFVKREQPHMHQIFKDEEQNEFLVIEKQFWLRYKKEFQEMGFLPEQTLKGGKIQMAENFKRTMV